MRKAAFFDFANARRRVRTNLIYRVLNPARYLVDRARLSLTSGSRSVKKARDRATKVLLISDASASTSEEQFSPFSLCRAELRDQLRIISTHLLIKDVLRSPSLIYRPFDVVILKMSFRTERKEALTIARTVKGALNDRRLIYFDGDDDLCVQWPQLLPYVDLYVKKHLFRDRNQYLKRFTGKSNLTDFVHRTYDYSFADNPVATESTPLPADQIPKLAVGCNLASDRSIFELYEHSRLRPVESAKEYDVVFRGSIPNDWMYYLRKDVKPALQRLAMRYRIITPENRVPTEEYYREMRRGRICVSPFGYGEVCWRDFEAILCGALVIKPDMSHVETNPDIFRPHHTYVPVAWDFSDLEEKCSYYLEHDDERRRITEQAFNALDEFYKNCGVSSSVSNFLSHTFRQ